MTPDEYDRIIKRNLFSMGVLSSRIGDLTRENVELLSIIDELQRDLHEAHEVLGNLRDSEDVLHPGVASDHAVVSG